MKTAPLPPSWWATPLLTGIFVLIGVIVAQLVAYRLEAVRRKREDKQRNVEESQRWHRELLTLYGEFSTVLDGMILDPLHKADDSPDLQRATAVFNQILVVGPEHVVEEAFNYMRFAIRIMEAAKETGQWGALLDEGWANRNAAFIDSARSSLGLAPLQFLQDQSVVRRTGSSTPSG